MITINKLQNKQPKLYTYTEMLASPGIYGYDPVKVFKPDYEDDYVDPNIRFIIGHGINLFVHYDQLINIAEGIWKHERFIKLNESITIS